MLSIVTAMRKRQTMRHELVDRNFWQLGFCHFFVFSCKMVTPVIWDTGAQLWYAREYDLGMIYGSIWLGNITSAAASILKPYQVALGLLISTEEQSAQPVIETIHVIISFCTYLNSIFSFIQFPEYTSSSFACHLYECLFIYIMKPVLDMWNETCRGSVSWRFGLVKTISHARPI
jgi:hypothetical protein